MLDFCFADTNMLVSEKPCGPNAKPHTPNVNPNATEWNMSLVGSPHIGAHIGHVHFMLFASISFTLGSQHKRTFWWNMAFIETAHYV